MNALNTHRSSAVLLRLLVAVLAALLLGALTVLPALAAGTWTLTGSLNTARQLHMMTRLQNGQVLVAGGQDASSHTLASAELYNPASGTWTLTGSMNIAHAYHTATLLQSGQVLVAGGVSYYGYVTVTTELYTP